MIDCIVIYTACFIFTGICVALVYEALIKNGF